MPLAARAITHGSRYFWLLADQGIYALSSFAISVLFARWLSPTEFGIFAVTFSGYLILSLLHYGMILEPLLVQSGRVQASCRHSYIRTVIKAHTIANAVVIGTCLIGAAIALETGFTTTGWGILGAGVGGVMTLTLLAARRLCLIFLTARTSTLVGFIYLLGVVSSAYSLHLNDMVTWFAIWLVIGAWGLVCSVMLFGLLCRSTSLAHGTEPYSLRTLYQFQLGYAFYATAAASCQWFRVEGVLLMLASMVGLEAVAETRAMFNITQPLGQVNLALSATWLIQASQAHVQQQRAPIWQLALPYGAVAAVLVVAGWWYGDDLVRIFYGGRYLTGAWQLPCLLLTVAFNGVENMLTSSLKGRGYIRRGYMPTLVGAVIAIILGACLVPTLGTVGAVAAIVASFGGGLMLAIAVYR